jgi:hypothetical protein
MAANARQLYVADGRGLRQPENAMTRQRIHDTEPMRTIDDGTSMPVRNTLRMTPADSPSAAADATDPGPAPMSNADPTDPSHSLDTTDPAGPVEHRQPMPFGPSKEDAKIHQLLSNLQSARAPAPLNAPSTDGELAAKYHAPIRQVPARNRTPEPVLKTILECTSETELSGSQAAASESPTPPLSSSSSAASPTVILPRRLVQRRERRAVIIFGSAIIAAIALFAFIIVALLRAPSRPTSAASLEASGTSQPTSQPIPSSPPAFPLPTPIETSAQPTSSSNSATNVAPPTMSTTRAARPPKASTSAKTTDTAARPSAAVDGLKTNPPAPPVAPSPPRSDLDRSQ